MDEIEGGVDKVAWGQKHRGGGGGQKLKVDMCNKEIVRCATLNKIAKTSRMTRSDGACGPPPKNSMSPKHS